MAKYYDVEEFISSNNKSTDTLEDIVDKKIALLYDICILRRTKYSKHDSREQSVREYLTKCGTESRITSVLHDILMYNKTLDELLQEGGINKCIRQHSQPKNYLVSI